MKPVLVLIPMLVWLLNSSSQAQHWVQMGSLNPVQGDFNRMFVDTISNTLYLGGQFQYLGGKECRGAAKWNGTEWDNMGLGFDRSNMPNTFTGNVFKILRFKNKIYYFGTFTQAGTYNTIGMAIWNGTAWDSTANLPNGSVFDADVYQDTLYICGGFTKIGTQNINKVAKFDGSTWYDLSFPMGAMNVRAYKDKVYLVGSWYQNGYSLTAEWSYQNGWKPSLGVQGDITKTLFGLERIDTLLYFFGRFTHLSTMYSPGIAAYSGTQLYGFGEGVGTSNYSTVMKAKKIDGRVFAVGQFYNANNMAFGNTNLGIAELFNNQWCVYNENFDNPVRDIVKYNGDRIICGAFDMVDSDSVKKVAKWVGGNYTYSCSPFTLAVSGVEEQAMAQDGVYLYSNPATDKITIEIPGKAEADINVLNILGQTLFSQKKIQNGTEINIDYLPRGIYLIRIQGSLYDKMIKVVKE